MRDRLWLYTVASVSVTLALWGAATWSGMVSPLFLPSPDQVWSGGLDLFQSGYNGVTLGQDIAISLFRIFVGFGAGAIVGVLVGLAMGSWRGFNAIVEPYIEFLRPLPQLGYLVLLIVWFGIGETSKIMLLFLTALPVAAVAARDGVLSVPAQRLQAARMLGASEMQIFFHVVLPSALPEIFIGMRLAIGLVYATLIAAEILAGSDGIGWVVFNAGQFLRADYVFVGIIIIGLMGVLMDRALVLSERRIVHWAGR
jgi:ABC-type nitrate/sulfonate/bicarbonate transport system permease component